MDYNLQCLTINVDSAFDSQTRSSWLTLIVSVTMATKENM